MTTNKCTFDCHIRVNILTNKKVCHFISLRRGRLEWIMTFTTNHRRKTPVVTGFDVTGPFDEHL